MKVLIIDYGMGNVGSVKRAIEECDVDNVVISHQHSDFDDCTHAILPGVGAFPDAMKNLESFGLVKKIKSLALDDKVPFLGICLGMQLLATKGTEVSEQEGLDLIPGRVELLSSSTKERIPHVGWNEIHYQNPSDSFLQGVPDKADFYFVHSFHFVPQLNEHVLAKTPYGGNFVSIVRSSNIIGTQFHPEKSSTMGFQLLKNFLNF
jgi:imidazole glycerol-phosphate synthase subunit HisH